MLFVFKARRRAHSRVYVTEAATTKTDDRASKTGKLFLDDSLGPDNRYSMINARAEMVNTKPACRTMQLSRRRQGV